MPCSRVEAIASLFSNLCTSINCFFIFSLCFVKLFTSFFIRGNKEHDDGLSNEGEGEEEEVEEQDDHEEVEEELEQENRNSENDRDDYFIPSDLVNNGQGFTSISQEFQHHENEYRRRLCRSGVLEGPVENIVQDTMFYVEDCTTNTDIDDEHVQCSALEVFKTEYATTSQSNPTQTIYNHHNLNTNYEVGEIEEKEIQVVKEETKISRDDKRFLILNPPKSEAMKLETFEKEQRDETFEDTFTIGSTSKSSSEWRSSIRDSGTELDPFSSSSRRSCPKWESYTVYQKYDEEMMFLDTITAQKLHETESLKSILVEPRSISQRIVHKYCTKPKPSNLIYKKSYNELEAAYVAQMCLAWEALNWNYANFLRKHASRKEPHPGCPEYIAQQFQQFQVLLHRYVETEPYERGCRPEIYARMRSIAPKLLQVPEYHDCEEEEKKEGEDRRIACSSFLSILEEAIQTFKNFVTADRSQCQSLISLFKRRRTQSVVNPGLVHIVQKHNRKMKSKVKVLQRSCFSFKKKKFTREEEMELMMSLIDLKVVSRVLQVSDLRGEQLQWCEDKMCKVVVLDGILHRDFSPLFFPA